MYHVQMGFKGLTKDGRLLIDMPNKLLKAHNIYIQDFKIYTEKTSSGPEDVTKYYFDTSTSLFIKKKKTMEAFLDAVRQTVTEVTFKHGVDIINSDITIDQFGDDELITGQLEEEKGSGS